MSSCRSTLAGLERSRREQPAARQLVTSVAVFATSGVMRAGLEALVQGSSWLTLRGSSATVSDLRRVLDSEGPDVVIADISTDSSVDVLDVLDQASAVVMLAADGDQEPVRIALRLGARAVLGRAAEPEEILSAVDAVGAGLVVLESGRAAGFSQAVPASARGRDTAVEELTPREMEVLAMLAEALGNKMIARRLGISEHTVKFHIASIFGKLGAGTRTEAVTIGIRQGLVSI